MKETEQSPCVDCPAHNTSNLLQLGVDMSDSDYVVALAGNPNTGKSTVFNALTGLRQHTGNWPGKTVSRAEGGFSFSDRKYKLVDLPGTYSLMSTSTDEEIARNFILFGQPDVTVIVVDATRLERNLNLVLQILEITDRVVVCLNLIDEAERHGVRIDERLLAKELGVQVIPTAARQRTGLPELLRAIHDVATGNYINQPHRVRNQHKRLERAVSELAEMIERRFRGLRNSRWVALRLLEGDTVISQSVSAGDLQNISVAGVPGQQQEPAGGASNG
ncbi:MAG: 50S ribosome-binding GTPase [Ignavibacteria bacterium]|nr:50S ribosome-binding GTPase [Ignavibacteria bacterium]